MVQHYLSDEGMKAACRVLSVVAYERPDITYSPLLFTLTAILLHYLDEAACYTCVSSLVTSRRRYFAQTMISYQAQILTLSDLALKHVVCMFSCSKVIDYHIHQGQYKENSAGMLISASSIFRIWLRGGHDLKAPQSSGAVGRECPSTQPTGGVAAFPAGVQGKARLQTIFIVYQG